MRPRKKLISIRIGAQALEWFRKAAPSGYQTLINSVLEEHVEAQTHSRAHSAGRAQELFRRFYSQCFWHYDRDLRISTQNMDLVIDGLRKYGGREGFILAEELCR